MTHTDYYKILGLSIEATPCEIRSAFRRLAREYHPDVNPHDPQAEGKFKEIEEAYEVLSDPAKRAKYNQSLGCDLSHQRQNTSRSDESTWRTSPPNESALIQFVIRQFKRHIKRNDIIYQLCMMTDMYWSEAEAFTFRVESLYWNAGNPRHRVQNSDNHVNGNKLRERIARLPVLIALPILLCIVAAYLIKSWDDHISFDHIVFTTSLPQDSPHVDSSMNWSRRIWAESGQSLQVNYSAVVDSGSLHILVLKGGSFHVPFGLPEGFAITLPSLPAVAIERNSDGSFEVPITDSADYLLIVRMYEFTGHFDVSWKLNPAP